jgi:putative transposase
LVTEEYYHVYNRGVARQPVFLTKHDYERFRLSLEHYRFRDPPLRLSHFLQLSQSGRPPLAQQPDKTEQHLVAVVSFVLMPNHFHLLAQQTADHGISTFVSRAVNSYTRYFNARHERVGPLFQGTFKAVRVETDAQLIHLSRYIHLNPVTSHAIKTAEWLTYPWSSFPAFHQGHSTWLNLKPVLAHFASPRAYETFVSDRAAYTKTLKRIAHLALEH